MRALLILVAHSAGLPAQLPLETYGEGTIVFVEHEGTEAQSLQLSYGFLEVPDYHSHVVETSGGEGRFF